MVVFEHKSGTSITSLSLIHNRLFVAYETGYVTSKGTVGEEGEKVGGIQMWDLGNAGATPVEFQVSGVGHFVFCIFCFLF